MSVTPTDNCNPIRIGRARRQGERHALAMVVLCLLFVLMLAEPLICVRYWQTEMQRGAHSQFAAQRPPHERAPHNGMIAERVNVRAVLSANLFVCFTDAQDSFPFDLPNQLLAVEQHDHQATAVAILLLILILAVLRHLSALPRASLYGVLHPLLRPPIALAA